LKVEDVETLNLDIYFAMLNIGLLGGEGVPFFIIALVSSMREKYRSIILRVYQRRRKIL